MRDATNVQSIYPNALSFVTFSIKNISFKFFIKSIISRVECLFEEVKDHESLRDC